MVHKSRAITSRQIRANSGAGWALLPIAILAILMINLHVYPIIPQPWGGQVNNYVQPITTKISKVVTFTIDATGRLTVELKNTLNITAAVAKNPVIETVATVHTKGTQITGAEVDSTLHLLEINFTAPIPNRNVELDQTLFTWNFPIDSLPLGVTTLTAAVVLSIIGCGSCANTTLMVPVDLQTTASVGSAS